MERSGSTEDKVEQDQELDDRLAAAQVAVAKDQRRLLAIVAECERSELWQEDGARDLPAWLATRLGISCWAARRWITAAHALPRLPLIESAFTAGSLSLDKVLELCRFATQEEEARLVRWAQRVTIAAIRHRADIAARLARSDVVEDDRQRFVRTWWCEGGRLLGLAGSFPADQGAVLVTALNRIADQMPDIVDDSPDAVATGLPPEDRLEARRADALVALASQALAAEADADRATVVVHTELGALVGDAGCGLEEGGVINAETARRLLCDGRLQTVLYRGDRPLGVGRLSRTAPRWLLRLLRHRDGGCAFPGCESRRFLQAHHIVHWLWGGATDLDNLVLVCTFHHKLLHEYGWEVRLEGPSGTARWFRPGGRELYPPEASFPSGLSPPGACSPCTEACGAGP